MKTIKQAAKEYADTKAPVVVSGTKITNTIDDLNLYSKTDFTEGAKFAQQFISIEDELPIEGKPVLLFSRDWIDEDFCPDGVREGVYFDEIFVSAKWNNIHDCYDTKTDIPTHWRPTERK